MRLQINSIAILIMGSLLSSSLADCIIYPKNCAGKTQYVIDRDPNEGTGTPCSCPCTNATWMGIQGIYYTPKEGSIWYNFPCETANYKVTIHYEGDTDGYAKFKIYVDGKEIGNGTIGHTSGSQTFGPVCVKKGGEVKVWLRSDYSTGGDGGKHGNYGRFNKLTFQKTGACATTSSMGSKASHLAGNITPEVRISKNGLRIEGASAYNRVLVYDALGNVIARTARPGSGVEGSLLVSRQAASVLFVQTVDQDGRVVSRTITSGLHR